MTLERALILVLVPCVLASAFAVVYSKHQSRKLFVQLQELQAKRDRMNIEWGRLQLEQSTYATHGRIEQIANEKLNMTLPSTDSVVIVRR